MADNFEFKVDVDLGPYGGKHAFTSIADLEQWLAVENSFWAWHQDSLQREPQANNFVSQYRARISNLQSMVAQLKTHTNIDEFNRKKDQLLSQLRLYYNQNQLVHSSMSVSNFIKSFIASNPLKAANILRYLLDRKSVPVQDTSSFEAAIDLLMFEAGATVLSKTEAQALSSLHAVWQAELNKSKQVSAEMQADHERILKEFNTSGDTQAKTFNTWLEESKKDYENLRNAAQTELKNIKETYDRKLALHSAIKYWESKANGHAWWAFGILVGVVVTFIFGGQWLYQSIQNFLGDDTWQDIELWKIGCVLFLVTLVVWSLRILIRLLLSQIHLANDAQERRTMILTYLSLKREGDLPDAKEKALILQAIFRPTPTGIVKDDGVPQFIAQWLKHVTEND